MGRREGEDRETNEPLAVTFRAADEEDFESAATYHNAQLPGLGDEFLMEVDARLAVVKRYPRIYPSVDDGMRRAILQRFPYAIFYVVDDEAIVVLGCLHTARDPRLWKRLR